MTHQTNQVITGQTTIDFMENYINLILDELQGDTPRKKFESLKKIKIEIDEQKETLKSICDMCDNENPSHEMIWRLSHGCLNKVTL